ncbi:MAG TPA: macro domain-containing protein [Tepidisphaeraceae bacterium]|jgi:O-acetyl-ADP-ribose deacetylase (regulator of RNase III)|nr:macro domain-containing protein [Tepidisphaeraceae bacterium]
MIRFTQGNLLDARVEAVVNTVNTVGVMGKGIALMFKERFPDNYKAYEAGCKRHEVVIGRMFVTESLELSGPRWIINFPTKNHWRQPSKLEWIIEGLQDLRRVLKDNRIRSVAVPPLGSGNGGLEWSKVRPEVEAELVDLPDVEIIVYEPTAKYQNVAKGRGVEKLTPARAIIAETIRRYGLMGLECSILEVQKLAWVLTRVITGTKLRDPLALTFAADKYGPYAHQLTHLLNAMDGSYLHCEKRIADASPFDTIYFDPEWRPQLANYFASSQGAPYIEVVNKTDEVIDGFQSPLGMEALATVDWLIMRERFQPLLPSIREGLKRWPGGAGERKERLFSDKLLRASLDRVKLLSA